MTDDKIRMRYSDEELKEFKRIINEKIDAARANYELLMDRIKADESASTINTLEEGTIALEKEEASQRAARQLDFIKKLQGALIRIENKTYGVCRVTGKLIPKERLLAVPHTTLSVEGKEIEQQRKLR